MFSAWALIYGTAGILAPLASQWMWNYTLGNLRYGDRPINCEPRLEKLYRPVVAAGARVRRRGLCC